MLSQTSGAQMLVMVPGLQDYNNGYSLFKNLKVIHFHLIYLQWVAQMHYSAWCCYWQTLGVFPLANCVP